MSAITLDVTGWQIVNIGGGWRHVSHERRLATSHWGTQEAAERNAGGYRGDAGVMPRLAARYVELFNAESAS